MKNLGRKLFALLLCVLFCCSLMPVYAVEKPVWTADEVNASAESAANSSGIPAVANAGAHGLTAWVYQTGSGQYLRLETGYNRSAKLRVGASVTDGTALTYQWYELNEEDVDKTDCTFIYKASQAISKATKASYKTPVITDASQKRYFGCVVTDVDGVTAKVLFEVSCIYNTYFDQPVSSPKGVHLPYLFGISINEGFFYYSSPSGYGGQPTKVYTLSNATKYQLYRTETGGKWETLKTIKGGGPDGPGYGGDWSQYIRDYTDTTAKMGVTYYYRYRAYLNDAWTPKTTTKSLTFNPFTDVSLEEERAQYIAWAYNNNVVKGDGNGHFNPDDPCTRMNFVMILWKMHGKPSVSGSNPFSDVSGNTSVKAVTWAVKKKLVTGTSATTFSPDDNLSRINIIMILYKLAGSPAASTECEYDDISGSKTTKAVNWAVGNGIIEPVDTMSFDPNGNCSRALLVEVLCKYNEIYKILK